jgi:hypothetical protein
MVRADQQVLSPMALEHRLENRRTFTVRLELANEQDEYAPEERARLEAAIEEAEEDIERGDYVDALEFANQLLAKRFADEFRKTLALLEHSPHAGALWPTTKRPTLRRILMPETHNHLYYRVDDA